MSKTENELKSDMVKKINERRSEQWYARRLEDQFAVGVMDMVVGIPRGPTVAIEAKRVEHQSFGPTSRQWIELTRWESLPYRLSWVLGFKEGLMYLHVNYNSVKISDCLASLPGEHPCDFIMRFLQCLTIEASPSS